MPKVKEDKKDKTSKNLPTGKKVLSKKPQKIKDKSKVLAPKAAKTVLKISAKKAEKSEVPKKTSTPAQTKTKKVTSPDEQKIRIKIKAYDHRLIDECARKIVNDTLKQGASICGPIPLPTETRKWTINRSTFVHKDTRDQYEMRIFKRIIDVINPNSKIIDSLSRLDLPAGVDVEIKY